LDDPARALRYCEEAADLDHLASFDRLEIQLIAIECELAQGEEAAARRRMQGCAELSDLDTALDWASASETETSTDEAGRTDAAEYLDQDQDGEPLEAEERAERIERIL